MISQSKNTELNELGDKIVYGVNKALRKLVETSAVNDESLIIGDEYGNVKSVPAKELLRTLSK